MKLSTRFDIGGAGLLALLVVASFALSARAHEATGCSGFAWPVDTEIAWLKATVPQTQSGARLASVPDQAIDLQLAPADTVTLPAPASGKPDGELKSPHAGWFAIDEIATAGVYQVSLAGPGWIDVIQNGKALDSEEHPGARDCPAVSKTARFELAEGPATVEMSSVPDAHIKLVIRAVK